MMKGKTKSNPFACLGTIPVDQRPTKIINMDKDNNDDYNDDVDDDEYKSVPTTPRNSIIVPSLASVSRSLISSSTRTTPNTMNVMDRSFINRDYQFVFRSRPIDSCKYEPYKVILFIASAQGFGDNGNKNANDHNKKLDPRLSSKGISQCKIVSEALRKAKQASPNVMYSSTMYRALSTMQFVCSDWYDDIKSIGLDELRPKYGKFKSNKRSNIDLLKQDFKKVSFNHVKSDKDIYWKEDKMESEENLSMRIHKFINKFLIPQSELLRTQYGTIKSSKLENIGWNSSASSSTMISPQRSITSSSSSSSSINIDKRIVVISHREWLSYLMKNIIIDISPELCKDWKSCDLRKVFVYTKQQLGISDIPCYALSDGTYYSPNYNNNNSIRFGRKKYKNHHKHHSQRSKTPNNENNSRRRKHKKSSSMINYNDNNNSHNGIKRSNAISTTSTGDILMTNKLFESHTFTLTRVSAALCNNKPMPIIPLQSSRSADYSSSLNNSNNNNDDDDDDQIRVIEPGDLLKEIDSNILPSIHPIQHYSRSDESPPHHINNLEQTPKLTMSTSTNSYRSEKMSIKPKQHRIIVTPPTKSTMTKFSNIKPDYDDQ